MIKKTCLILLIVGFIFSCRDGKGQCSFQFVSVDKSIYEVNGCLVDSLETGQWTIYDTAHNVLQKGEFLRGLRIGQWNYTKEKKDQPITWKLIGDTTLNIRTNIPEQFKVVQTDEHFIKFNLLDTTQKLTIVIGVHNLDESKLSVETYYKQGEAEIAEHGWTYEYQRNKLISKGNAFYMNRYKLSKANDKMNILNFYGSSPDKKLVEITVTFGNEADWLARVVFTSIVSNLFIGSDRFINPFDRIENI